ncbi:MAG: phospholipid carrier-dependent glycosyltransferase [bacterium]
MAILAALFLCLCFPLLGSLAHWRADERFYTDAALRMVQTGDWLSPTYADGSPRFKKPVLSYWAILASWKSLGIGYESTRLPSLLAGTGTVWLTFELALLLWRRPREALVAAAITGSNMTVMLLSTRSTPDIFLCFFTTASLLGFAGLILRRKLSTGYYALAYFGAALAVATKGLAGILPVLYAYLYCALARPRGVRLRDLIHPAIMVCAVAIPATWFALAVAKHGRFALMDLFMDQIGRRLSGSKVYILANLGHYLGSVTGQFLPWSLLALTALAANSLKCLEQFRIHRREALFAAGWVLMLYILFACGNQQRARYLLPAYPQVALLLALAIGSSIRNETFPRPVEWTVRLLYALGLTAGIGLMTMAPLIGIPMAAGGIIAAAAVLFAVVTWRWAATHRLAALGVCLLLIMVVITRGVMGAFFLSPARTIVDRVRGWNPDCARIPVAGLHSNYVCQIRVISGGRIEPLVIQDERYDDALRAAGAVVCSDAVLRRWNPVDCLIEPCGRSGREWNRRDVVAFLNPRMRENALTAKRMTYHLIMITRAVTQLPAPPPAAVPQPGGKS